MSHLKFSEKVRRLWSPLSTLVVGSSQSRGRRLVGLGTALGVSMIALAGFPGSADAATQANLVIPKEQVFFLPTTNSDLQVVQQVTVQNTSNAAEDLQFQLPAGAVSPAVQGVSTSAVHVSGQDLVVTGGAKPGNTTEVISYTLPFSGQTSVQLTLHTNYPVYIMNIFVPIGNVALSAPGLMPQTETTSIAGTDFRVFSHGEMAANTDWTASISMLPTVTSTQAVKGLPIIGMSSQSSSTTWKAIGNLVMAAVILVVALVGIRSAVGKGAGKARVGAYQALMNSWEETERAFAEGRLEEPDYRKRTSVMKRRLAQMRQADSAKR